MKRSVVMEKMHIDGKMFVTSEELAKYCITFDLEYKSTIHYLLKMHYLIRIFQGVYYAKSLERTDTKIKKMYDPLEIVAKGLELKGVKNWYYGLHTALKLNNMTHEFFTVDDVVSDTVFRPKPVHVGRSQFRFVKFTPTVLDFGIKKLGMLRYSDPEKTILDFAYLWRYNGYPLERIALYVSDWMEYVSKDIAIKYSSAYPKTIQKIMSELADN